MDEEEIKVKPKSKQIFLNHIDTFHSGNVGKFLSQCVVGSTFQEEEEEEDTDKPLIREGLYEIIGTLLNEDIKNNNVDFAKRIVKFKEREDLFKIVLEADIIIYNILDDESQLDEANWVIKKLYDEAEKLLNQKQFILLSSVMTWAKTKQIDPDEEVQVPFTEEDFRRRRAHPNFTQLLNTEKNVIKMGSNKKEKLITYVVTSGLTYGCGENVLHYLFKSAWQNAPTLDVFGSGQNSLPTIHVLDLAGVIQNVMDRRPKTRYILATDDAKNTLEEIIKVISKNLSTGKIKYVTKEEVLTNEEIKQKEYDQLLIDIQIDPVYVKDNLRIKWVSEAGFVENIGKITKEFKLERNLVPFRACILGPPAVGKSTVSEQLANFYRIHWINLKDLIDETMVRLERSAAKVDVEVVEGEEDEADKAAEDAELLESVAESKTENGGRIDTQYITKFLKDKMLSKPCRNQGFLLDNYPKTKEQAEELFNVGDEEEEEEEEATQEDEEKPTFNKNLMPTHVFVLEADDDFLKKRIMSLPEVMVTGTHNTEDGFMRRMGEYKLVNNDEDSVLNYFEDNGVNVVHIDINKDVFKNVEKVLKELKMILGHTRNYHPSASQIAAENRLKELEKESHFSQMTEEKKRRKEEEDRLRDGRKEKWTKRLDGIKKEEATYLEEKSQPLRSYLLRHVMPVLTQGLIECVKERPDNAVDYLAEYLFRNNPQYD